MTDRRPPREPVALLLAGIGLGDQDPEAPSAVEEPRAIPAPRVHSTTRGFSIASDAAISEAKKTGIARKPPSASGAFDGGTNDRSVLTADLPRSRGRGTLVSAAPWGW